MPTEDELQIADALDDDERYDGAEAVPLLQRLAPA
jgi:hypothetical protein